jgi:hypothetical protein
MNTLFFRLFSHEDKAAAMSEAVAAVSEDHALNPVAHAVNPASFRQVPGWGSTDSGDEGAGDK